MVSMETVPHVLAGERAALAGGILLVPALGLTGTAWLTVGLEALALVGVGLSAPRAPGAHQP